MSNNKYKISENIMHGILQNVLQVKNTPNRETIYNILNNELSEHGKEAILHLALTDEYYKPVEIGSYVTLNPPTYHAGEKFEWDILKDMGLYAGNNQVYAKVLGDSSWGDKFNPFYSHIKLALMYHDDEKKLNEIEYQASPLDLTVVNVDTIKYFDILATDSEPIHHTSESIFPNEEQNSNNNG